MGEDEKCSTCLKCGHIEGSAYAMWPWVEYGMLEGELPTTSNSHLSSCGKLISVPIIGSSLATVCIRFVSIIHFFISVYIITANHSFIDVVMTKR